MKNIKTFEEYVAGVTEGSYQSQFAVDDVVANHKEKTIGIVRLADDQYGEVKTDADGNVSVEDIELYDATKHANYSIAPSTQKEIRQRKLAQL